MQNIICRVAMQIKIYKVTSKLFSNHHIFCLSKSYFLRCIKIMNLWLYLVMSFWVILKRDALCLQLCSVNLSTRHVQDFTNKGYIVAICPPLNCIPQVLKFQSIVLSWKLASSIFYGLLVWLWKTCKQLKEGKYTSYFHISFH